MQQLTARSLIAVGAEESTSDAIRSALARGLPEFQPALCYNDGHMVIVGSGPSIVSFLEEIKEERNNGRPIVAIKGTHDWLVENGVEPDLFVSCEPKDRPILKPNDRTKYLLASRCNPNQFENLKDKQVVLWHSFASKPGTFPTGTEREWADFNPVDECEVWKGRLGVGGGSTSGMRAITLGYLMGFRNFILYGFDSCLSSDRKTKRFTGETAPEKNIIDVICDGRRFWCNYALAEQAIQFQKMVDQLPGIRIQVKGDGLIAAIMKARQKRDYE